MEPPFAPAVSSSAFSGVSGLIAGFALAGVFLLIQSLASASVGERKQYTKAMLLLFISFLSGSITSFMYASTTGDLEYPRRSMYSFYFPCNTFAVSVFTLLCGINVVLSASVSEELLKLARRISYFVVALGILRVLIITFVAFDFFGSVYSDKYWVCVFSVIPILVSVIIINLFPCIRERIQQQTINMFGYCCMGVVFFESFLQAPYPLHADTLVTFPYWSATIIMISTSLLGSWSMLLAPLHNVENAAEQHRAVSTSADAWAISLGEHRSESLSKNGSV